WLAQRLRLLHNGNLNRFGLLVPDQLHRDLLPDRSLRNGIPQMRRRIHDLAVIFNDDISPLKPCLLRRTIRQDIADKYTLRVNDPELAPHIREPNLNSTD